jgi:hypothetical protein
MLEGDVFAAVKAFSWKGISVFGAYVLEVCISRQLMANRCPDQFGTLIVLGVAFMVAVAVAALSSKNCMSLV